MAVSQTISQLNNSEIDEVIKLLLPLDNQLDKRTNYVMKTLNMAKNEALEYIVTDNPILWAKVYLDWEARDYQFAIITEGKKSKKLVLRLGRRLGKCLSPSSLILNSQTGQYETIEDLYNKQQETYLWSLNINTQKLVQQKTNIITNNGVKPTYRLKTYSGRIIECTGNHPFYCIDGYKELDNLKPEDYISIAKVPEPISPMTIEDNIIKFIAYMIGDGGCTRYTRFHNDTPEIINEMFDIVKDLKCELRFLNDESGVSYSITGKQISNTKYEHTYCLDILKKYGLYGKKSIEKTIPKEIFSLTNTQLALFLNRLYSTDGWVTSSFKEKGRCEIGYCTSNKEMAIQIQSLLLRFGINSILYNKRSKVSKESTKYFHSYSIGIYAKHDIETFIKEIDIFGRQQQIKQLQNVLNKIKSYGRNVPIEINKIIEQEINKKGISKRQLRNATGYRLDQHYNSITLDKLQKANDYIQSKEIQKHIDSDIIWDKIRCIEYIGEQQTYDFTVPDYHNFVVNDFITHNTDSMCILILWFAYTQYNKGPNNQYDIIIATPYETQIDLIFKRLHQLIEMSPLLKGLISRDVHHNICFNINGVVSNILGLTAGANNSSGGANSTRGQILSQII